MTTRLPRSRSLGPRAGSAVTSLFLGALTLSAVVATIVPLGVAPASAQSAANPNDQPTPGTLPARTGAGPADRPTGQVSPPKAISNSTSVVASDSKKTTRTNPLDHLPAQDRAGTGGRGE